jgi:hypothetical protein
MLCFSKQTGPGGSRMRVFQVVPTASSRLDVPTQHNGHEKSRSLVFSSPKPTMDATDTHCVTGMNDTGNGQRKDDKIDLHSYTFGRMCL